MRTFLNLILVSNVLGFTVNQNILSLTKQEWSKEASIHNFEIIKYLYPGQVENDKLNIKERQHMVDEHPIYNFIHTYYRFPVSKLIPYSPGLEGKRTMIVLLFIRKTKSYLFLKKSSWKEL